MAVQEPIVTGVQSLSFQHASKAPAVEVHEVETNGVASALDSHNNELDKPQSLNGASTYTIVEQTIKQPRRMRVVAVGAGIAGLALLYKTKHFEDIEVEVYEKFPDVGGVWLANRYPGCSCDIPAHIYTFSFEGNPNWSRYYATAEEIFDYYKSFAHRHELYDRIRLQHKVRSAAWNQTKSQWDIEVEDLSTGRVFETSADVFVNASGALSHYKWPDIKGLDTFKGKLVHSAAWDDKYSFEDKNVAVIGAGASAVQVLPRLAPKVKTLTSFNRSKVWISAEFVDAYAPDGRETTYSPEMIKRFNEDPEYLKAYRKQLTEQMCQVFNLFTRDHPAQKAAFENSTASMKRRLGEREDLAEALVPTYPVGCRRTTPATGYLEALTKPNARVVTSRIVEAVEDGLITADGEHHKLDAIVAATGFDTSFKPVFPVKGLEGRDLAKEWADTPTAYLSLAVPGFPNYFVMNGPNAPFANGSLVYGIECMADYIIKFVQKVQTEGIRYMNIKQDALDDWIEHKNEFMKRMVWSADCSSWYKNGKKDGPVIGPWAGSILHFADALQSPRFEDYDIVYQRRNRFSYFGNGRSITEAKGLPLSSYITA